MPDKTNDSKEKAHPTRIFQPVAAYQSGTYVTQQVADGLKSQNALMPVISLPLHPTGAREAPALRLRSLELTARFFAP